MKILIACEESQAVTIEFRKRDFEAFSCDILPCSGGHPEWHIQGDVLEILNDGWDAMIAFPPCTYLTVTGARWLYNKDGSKNISRWESQYEAVEFVKRLYYCNIKRVAIENPVGKLSSIWMKPTQIIQPYFFGDEAQKTTCLWLKKLPQLIHNKQPNLFDHKVTHCGKGEMVTTSTGKTFSKWYWETSKAKGKERQIMRSKTFPGIARAMAEQWGDFLLNKNKP
jgi:site-specific DNA-cytosine methylase